MNAQKLESKFRAKLARTKLVLPGYDADPQFWKGVAIFLRTMKKLNDGHRKYQTRRAPTRNALMARCDALLASLRDARTDLDTLIECYRMESPVEISNDAIDIGREVARARESITTAFNVLETAARRTRSVYRGASMNDRNRRPDFEGWFRRQFVRNAAVLFAKLQKVNLRPLTLSHKPKSQFVSFLRALNAVGKFGLRDVAPDSLGGYSEDSLVLWREAIAAELGRTAAERERARARARYFVFSN